jgi:hypothetical protein
MGRGRTRLVPPSLKAYDQGGGPFSRPLLDGLLMACAFARTSSLRGPDVVCRGTPSLASISSNVGSADRSPGDRARVSSYSDEGENQAPWSVLVLPSR